MEINIKKAEGNAINILITGNNDNKNEESSNENIKKAIFFDKKPFKVDEIIEKCKEKDGIELLNYMCSIMQERKRNILEMLYKDLGKDYLIVKLEKTLIIENSGGLLKEKNIYAKKNEEKGNESKVKDNNSSGKKSTGGIFFTLIKKDPEAKKILSKAAKQDYKESKNRKKVYKLLEKLNI